MKFLKKYPAFAAVTVFVLVLAGILVVNQRSKVIEERAELKFPNEPVSGEEQTDTFYSGQLTEKERRAYEQMTARLDGLEGGVVEFEEPLTGREYVRVTSAIENECAYFYGFYEIPMNEANVYLKYVDKDLTNIKEAEIEKAILFLSCAADINMQGEYAEDGTVKNLSEVEQGLSVNDGKRVEKLRGMQEKEEQRVDEIVAEIPKDAGEWDTLNYFLDWMDENLTYYAELGEEAFSFTTMEDVLENAYVSNNPACILEGKATMLGYTKLLSLLCNRVGIPSHIVMGTWGRNGKEGYTMCAVELSGETVYVDAAGVKSAQLAGIRCLKEQEALNHMGMVSYFNCGNSPKEP